MTLKGLRPGSREVGIWEPPRPTASSYRCPEGSSPKLSFPLTGHLHDVDRADCPLDPSWTLAGLPQLPKPTPGPRFTVKSGQGCLSWDSLPSPGGLRGWENPKLTVGTRRGGALSPCVAWVIAEPGGQGQTQPHQTDPCQSAAQATQATQPRHSLKVAQQHG